MVEGVGGVRRARAVVHSRAVASLFPDYSALITLNRAEELTDELIKEKLGLDHPYANAQLNGNANSTSPPTSLSHHGESANAGPDGTRTAGVGMASMPQAVQGAAISRSTGSTSAVPPARTSTSTEPVESSTSIATSEYMTSRSTPRHSTDSANRTPGASRTLPTSHITTGAQGLEIPSQGQVRGTSPSFSASAPHQPSSTSSTTGHEPHVAAMAEDALSPTSVSSSNTPAINHNSSPDTAPQALGAPLGLPVASQQEAVPNSIQPRDVETREPIRESSTESPAGKGSLDAAVTTDAEPDIAPVAASHDLEGARQGVVPAVTDQDHAAPAAADIDASQNLTPSGRRAPLPLAPSPRTGSPRGSPGPSSPRQSTVIHPDRPLDVKGISSSDVFGENRNRKASLSSRLGSLGQAFGRGAHGKSPSQSSSAGQAAPSSDFSPGPGVSNNIGSLGEKKTGSPPASTRQKNQSSPTMSRFMNSSLVKGFGRRIPATGPGSNDSSPASPLDPNASAIAQRDDAPPPLPPKDGPIASSAHTPYGVVGQNYTPSEQTTEDSTAAGGGHVSTSHMVTGDLSPGDARSGNGGNTFGRSDGFSPSPSAKTALAQASQKSVKNEMEIQERFRRDQEQKMNDEAHRRRLSNKEDDADEEEGLPYDRPDPEEAPGPATTSTTAAAPDSSNARGVDAGDQVTESTPHQGLTGSEIAHTGTEESMMALNLAETGAAGAGAIVLAESMVHPPESGISEARDIPQEVSTGNLTAQAPTTDFVADNGHNPHSQGTNPPLGAVLGVPARVVAEKEAEQRRLKEVQEVEERRVEEARRIEAARLAEEQQLREVEQESRRLQAEKEAMDAEERRIAEQKRSQAEHEAEQKRLLELEAEEKRRKAAEEKRQREEHEAEQKRLQAEKESTEKRLKAEKEAEAVRRKEMVTNEMLRGKEGGHAMLSGVSDIGICFKLQIYNISVCECGSS